MAGNKVKIDLVADTKKATSALKKFTTGGIAGFKDLAKGMSTATKVALGVGVAVVAIGVAMVKLAKTIKAGTDEWAKQNDEIAKSAVQLGISTDALQEWNFIAERSGVSSGELASAFSLLQRNLAEAADGTAAQADALAKINLEASDLQNMRLEDSFKLIMERVAGLNTESEKSQVLMDLMGRSGSKLKTIVAGTGEEVTKLSKRFKELGGPISAEDLRAAEAYQDTMTDLSHSLKVVGNEFWRVFAPGVQWAAEKFIELVAATREFLGLTLEQQLEDNTAAQRKLNDELYGYRTALNDVMKHNEILNFTHKEYLQLIDGTREGLQEMNKSWQEGEDKLKWWYKYFRCLVCMTSRMCARGTKCINSFI